MIENEDGGVTGSIDVSRLDELDPKTDEAKAQVDALKAEAAQGQVQVAADSQAQNEGAVASNPTVDDVPQDDRTAQGIPAQDSRESQPEQQPEQQTAEQPAQQDQAAQPEQAQQEQARQRRQRGA